jgi:hypothetical protein
MIGKNIRIITICIFIIPLLTALASCGSAVSSTSSSTTTSANLFKRWESKTLASNMAFQQGINAVINGKNYLICNVIYGNSTSQKNMYVTIAILDISRPDIPVEISSLQTGQDDKPYICNLKLNGSILYVLTIDHLWIIDVSDPSQPKNVGQMPLIGATNIEESGKYAFIMSVTQTNEQTISTFDLSNPLQPLKIGQIAVPNIAFVNMMASGNLLFTLASRGLYIYDISAPYFLKQIGYLANTLAIPTLIAPEFIPNDFFDMALRGNFLYVTSGTDRLLVVDTSNPSAPTIVNEFETREQGTEIMISGETAYMFSYNGAIAFTERIDGLLTGIAISDSINPKELNSVSLPAPFIESVPESYGDMTEANNHLYFFDNRFPIIQIIDLNKSPWN